MGADNKSKKIPRHVAIIMDGNGRWAKKRGFIRTLGHEKGSDTVRDIVTEARSLGVEYLTLYTFSTENWGRSEKEVSFLMSLLEKFLASELKLMQDKDIRFMISGDLGMLPAKSREKVIFTINETKDNQSMVLNLALSYGGRQEILRALKNISSDYKVGKISEKEMEEFSPEKFSNYLYTSEMPDPEIMIRTGGDLRISNFLLWQMAYTEFYFTETYWPDFTAQEFRKALEVYGSRERRFGLEGQGKN